MATRTEIETLISQGLLDEAAEGARALDEATCCYLQGRIAWKRGLRSEAIAFYSRSAAADPAGPGAVALEQSRAIMDFYNKDMFNP